MKKIKMALFTLVIALILINYSIVMAGTFYLDTFGHWAEDTILWATNEANLFNGYPDGTFRPDDSITRAEYITILYRAAVEKKILSNDIINGETNNFELANESIDNTDVEVNESELVISDDNIDNTDNIIEENDEYTLQYDDLDNNFWAYKEISSIARFIDSYSTNMKFKDIFPGDKFEPNKYITREEAAILSSFFTTLPIDENTKEFKDIDQNYKYFDIIKNLVNNGIIKGYEDSTFKPYRNIIRAESATLIKRIYYDMDYLSGHYLNDIELIDYTLEDNFSLFGDYYNRELDEQDILYKKSVSTLEYINLMGYIPFEEQHLYLKDPIKTLKELKEAGYYNIVGVNYYLIKFDTISEEEKEMLLLELLDNYQLRNDIDDIESLLIFKECLNYNIEIDKLISSLDKWYDSTEEDITKLNIQFIKSKIYAKNNDYEKAIEIYNQDSPTDNIEILKCFIMNKAYLQFKINEFENAESILRDGWEVVKTNRHYLSYKSMYDKEFIGAIKKILMVQSEYYSKIIQ